MTRSDSISAALKVVDRVLKTSGRQAVETVAPRGYDFIGVAEWNLSRASVQAVLGYYTTKSAWDGRIATFLVPSDCLPMSGPLGSECEEERLRAATLQCIQEAGLSQIGTLNDQTGEDAPS
jgi:hypothetical protein